MKTTIFFSIFSFLFIAVGYIAAQALSAEFLPSNKDIVYLNAVKAIGLQNSKTYLHEAFVPKGNRICIKEIGLLIAVCYIVAQA